MDELHKVHFREGWLPGLFPAAQPGLRTFRGLEPLIACRVEQVIEGRSGTHTDRVENVTCGNCLRVLARAAQRALERTQ